MKVPAVPLDPAALLLIQPPAAALFVKFLVKTQANPSAIVRNVSLLAAGK